ncbi:MAG: hypothetical protein A4E58_02447 [Syntrophorhabdus sp. PtaB.Bin006]|nr:MAG: hypothetical protein A4E58_02447 [Syntrophorhabdus sp. PtaB.Bin006]
MNRNFSLSFVCLRGMRRRHPVHVLNNLFNVPRRHTASAEGKIESLHTGAVFVIIQTVSAVYPGRSEAVMPASSGCSWILDGFD